MKSNICKIFILFIVLTGYNLYGRENLKFGHLSIIDGLSKNGVTSILKDAKGFMWFGTYDGLNRFDGVDFKVYYHNIYDSTSISSNWINDLFEDSDGNLWIGTLNGLNYYNKEEDNFKHFTLDSRFFSNELTNSINTIIERDDKSLWVGSRYGLYVFDKVELKFYPLIDEINDNLNINNISALKKDSYDRLWIGTNAGSYTYNLAKERFINVIDNKKYAVNDLSISTIWEDVYGIIWIGTNDGLFKITENKVDVYKKSNTSSGINNNIIHCICEGPNGLIWIGTESGGLNQYDRSTNSFYHFLHDPTNPFSIGQNVVHSLYFDVNGILWAGHDAKGISYYDLNQKRFQHYIKQEGNSNSLSDNVVNCFYEDKNGLLWIGTSKGGLNVFDRGNEKYWSYKSHPTDPYSLSSEVVRTVFVDSKDNIWVGTYLGGLNRFDRKIQKFYHYQRDVNDPKSLSNNIVNTIMEDYAGKIWIGTHMGINVYDPENKRVEFLHHKHDSSIPTSLSSDRVNIIYEDSERNIWVGTDGGLNLFNPQKEKAFFTHHKHDKDDSTSISLDDISSIYEDKQNTLWVGTKGGGICKFNKKTNSFVSFNQDDGLANNTVHGILEDNNGNLWISTNKGLSKFNKKTGIFKNYTVNDGLQSDEFRYNAYYKNNSGEMFFGGINGFNVFYPDSIRDNTFVPPVVFTDFEIFNKPVQLKKYDQNSPLEKHISQTRNLLLSYKHNILTFGFAALNFTSPGENQYAYKLLGFDNDWNYIGTRNRISFTNLDPGNYTLEIIGSNNDGVWNENGPSINIEILPPFWKTTEAYLFYILFFIIITILIIRFFINRGKLRNELILEQKMHNIDLLKLQFFTNISHEIRTPLTLILGPLSSILAGIQNGKIKEQLLMINRNAEQLHRFINELLDFRKLEAGKMRLEIVRGDVVAFVKRIVDAFKQNGQQRDINIHFNTNIDKLNILFDRDKLEKILNNLLSNAIKYTPDGGSITVKFQHLKSIDKQGVNDPGKTAKECYKISVKDTGIGISSKEIDKIFNRFYQSDNTVFQKKGGTGIGLTLTKEFVNLLKGEIYVNSEQGKGSKFTIIFPIDPEELLNEYHTIKEPTETIKNKKRDNLDNFPVHEAGENIDLSVNKQKKPLLLVIDDNIDLLTFIRNELDQYYNIEEAKDGREGLEKAWELLPDLIISDILMPLVDGIEFCTKVKTDERTSHIPVILLTARTSVENIKEGLETGADDYITKPFNAELLISRVQNLIESRKKLRERFKHEVWLKPKDVAITPVDEVFLQRAIDIVEQNMSNPEFDVDSLAKKVGMGRTQLYQKLNALTNQSVKEFIRNLRLKRAVQLIEQNQITITEVAYKVGFQERASLYKAFKKQFGKSPTEYTNVNVES